MKRELKERPEYFPHSPLNASQTAYKPQLVIFLTRKGEFCGRNNLTGQGEHSPPR